MTPEQAYCLAGCDEPGVRARRVLLSMSTIHDYERIAERFRTGDGTRLATSITRICSWAPSVSSGPATSAT